MAGGQDKGMLKIAEGDTTEEGTYIWERRVFEETYELTGTVTINGADDVVGIEVKIEGVGNEANDPETDQENDEPGGRFRPRETDDPRERGIEKALAGECPGDSVPECGN